MPRRPATPPRKKPPAFKLPRYIAVEGPIRVGKSSLARILAERMHARRIQDCDEDNPFLADFIFEKDKIFAYLNLGNEELKLYERFFSRFSAEVRPPELVIYLQATPEVLRERVAKKAAASESRISLDYIEEVVRAYEHFFFRYAASNLLVVNTSEIDFVRSNTDLQQLLQRIEEPVQGTQYFLPLGNT